MDKITREFDAYNKRQRQLNLPQKTFKQYMQYHRGKSTYKPRAVANPMEATTAVRQSPKVPSGDMFDRFRGARKPEQTYTGDKLLGIATMHKSNSVPVFRKEDAEDIARMRR